MPTYPIQLKRNGTTAATPSSLLHGEVALNYADGKLFWKDASNVIQSFTFQAYALSSHSHGNITNAGAIGPTANLPIITTTSGVLTTGSFGTSAATFCEGNDSRLSDTRTPTDGSVTTAKIANDAVTYAKLQNVSATDRLLGRSSAGSGDVEEILCTAAGRALLSGADAAAQRNTLSIQPTASPAFTGGPSIINSGASDNATIRYGNSGQNWYVGLRGDTSNVFAVADDVTFRFQINTSGVITCFGQLLVTAGSASACGVAFSGDTNTGLAQIGGADTASLVTAGVERVRVGSNGRVQFFANSEKFGVQLNNGSTGNGPFLGSDGADILTISTSGGAERVRVDASGNVGIGASSPSSLTPRLHVSSAYSAATASTPYNGVFIASSDAQAANTGGVLSLGGLYDASSGPTRFAAIAGLKDNATSGEFGGYMAFYTRANGSAPAERLRINSAGEVLIGTTTDNGAYLLQVNSQIYATNATIATSDARFKANVQSLTDATAVIEALRPVAFDFLPHAERNFATERQVGLIAQEAQSALAGTDYADSVVAQCGDHLGLAYEKLVPVLIKALQESNARIAALEERVNHA